MVASIATQKLTLSSHPHLCLQLLRITTLNSTRRTWSCKMTRPSWTPQTHRQRSRTYWSLSGTSSTIRGRVAGKAVVATNLSINNNSSNLGALTQVTEANTRRSPSGAASVRVRRRKGKNPAAAVVSGTAHTNRGKISYSRTWSLRTLVAKNLRPLSIGSKSSSLRGQKSLTTVYTQHRYSHTKRRILDLPSSTMLASSGRRVSWPKSNDSRAQAFFLSNLKSNQILERRLCMS